MKLRGVVNSNPLSEESYNYEVTRTSIVLLGAYFTFLSAAQVESLSCSQCSMLDQANMCMDGSPDIIEPCSKNTTTCMIGTGLRKNLKLNGTELEPCMELSCSEPGHDSEEDALLWKQAKLRGDKMICMVISKENGLVDRRCVCGEDRCNRKPWNEIMVQPLLMMNQTATDKPITPTLGEYAVEKLQPKTTAVLTTSTKVTDPGGPGTNGSLESTTRVNAAEAGSSGLSPGLLAGVAVGGLGLVGLSGAALYWFKFRERKQRKSDATDVSNDSGESEASGSGDDD